MNRYPRGGPSRAGADTLCQKCLQRGHYSYECKASTSDRPYTARPSRTQQLLNPKYAPKLSEVAPPQDLERKQGVADEILAKKEEERGRKRQRLDEPGGSRSASGSSLSVSTISTGRSRSPSPPQQQQHSSRTRSDRHRRRSDHSRTDRKERRRRRQRSRSRSEQPYGAVDKKRNTGSSHRVQGANSRSVRDTPPRRSLRSPSPLLSRSRSPVESREQQQYSRHGRSAYDEPLPHSRRPEEYQPPRQRSLSPYSKRLALTQAMNR